MSKRTICQAFEKYCAATGIRVNDFDSLPMTHCNKKAVLRNFVRVSRDPVQVSETRLQPITILDGQTGHCNMRPSMAIADTQTDIVRIESLGDKDFALTLDLKEYIQQRVDEKMDETMKNLGQIIDDMSVSLQMSHTSSDLNISNSKLTTWARREHVDAD